MPKREEELTEGGDGIVETYSPQTYEEAKRIRGEVKARGFNVFGRDGLLHVTTRPTRVTSDVKSENQQ